tara:strand:+ start:780 stop:1754 length:975 start_codon:yes stop_codon:yes gene_type:complete
MKPKISVIVPIYKVEAYIHKCIDSIINQTYKNIEIILIDDESPDACGKICDEYAKQDERIVVIHQKNKGLSGARNAGLKVATGDYIGFVDSDDWIGLDMYKTMLDILLKHNLDIVECGFNETNRDLYYDKEFKLDLQIENSITALKRIIKNTQFSVWRRLYKKSIIKDSNFMLYKTSEDIYFTIDNIIKINKMGVIKFPFYNYRPNPDSITKSSYNLTRLNDSIAGSLYIQKTLAFNSDKDFKIIIKNHMLAKFLLHYKRLNYNSHIDLKYKNRKKIRNLIIQNYFISDQHDLYLKLARYLSVRSFCFLIKCNMLKHKILKTNQ